MAVGWKRCVGGCQNLVKRTKDTGTLPIKTQGKSGAEPNRGDARQRKKSRETDNRDYTVKALLRGVMTFPEYVGGLSKSFLSYFISDYGEIGEPRFQGGRENA